MMANVKKIVHLDNSKMNMATNVLIATKPVKLVLDQTQKTVPHARTDIA